jgi:DNA-binding SARP family transcriptional activator
VLGGLALELDGREIEAPAPLRARLLLGWLALNPGMHGRGELAARLRPDVLDESARATLRQAIWAVRAVIGEELLVTTRERVGLADGVAVDALEMAALVEAGKLDEAHELCGGDLLAGLDDEWVLAARDAQRDREDALLSALSERAIAAGDHATAVRYARRRAEAHVLSEEAHRALMRALVAAGDGAAALAVYDRLRERLRRELAVAPSAATRAAAEEVRAGAPEPTAGGAGGRWPAARRAGVAEAVPERLAAARRGVLVGREAELGAAEAAWARVRAGERLLLLLAGEPGIGKTRLAAELAARAHDEDAVVLYGRCEPEAPLPYQPWAEALRGLPAPVAGPHAAELGRLVPELGSPLAGDPEGERFRLFAAVSATLDALAPAMIVLDDLHWADRASLLLLHHVAGAGGPPLLLAGTYRDTDVLGAHPLATAVAALRRERRVERIVLGGLDDTALQELAGRPDLAASTGGNPFFAEEVVRHLQEGATGIPDGVRDVLVERLARLGDPVITALEAGAVAGPEFRVDVIEHALRVEALDALDAATAAGLTVEVPGAPGRYGFRHALVREALLTGQSAARRARLHERLAAAVEELVPEGAPGRAARLAHHALEANAPDAAPRGLAAAAEAMAGGAYEEAGDVLERVLRRAPPPDATRATVLLALGDARARHGAGDAARAAFDAAAESAADPHARAEAVLGAGGLTIALLGPDDALVERLERAAADLDPEDETILPRVQARLAVELAYGRGAQRDRSRALSAEALDRAHRGGSPAAIAAALTARRVALWDPRHLDERLAVATELLEVGQRTGEREVALQGHHWRVVDLWERGAIAEVEAEIDAYGALAEELRLPLHRWYVPLWRAALAAVRGEFEDAERLSTEAHALGLRAGDPNADLFRYIQRAAIAIEREAMAELDLAELDEHIARTTVPAAWRTGRAWYLATVGRMDEARTELLDLCADGLAALEWDANRLVCLCELAETAYLLGEARVGPVLHDAIAPFTDHVAIAGRAAGSYGPMSYYAGLAAALSGNEAAAREHVQAGRERAAAMGARPYAEKCARVLERLG